MFPWALISPSLLFDGQSPMRCCLADFGCCQPSQGSRGVVLWSCPSWCADTSQIALAGVAGWLHGEGNGTGQKNKAAEVSVRQQVYSQQQRALEVSWCAMAGGLVRTGVGLFLHACFSFC